MRVSPPDGQPHIVAVLVTHNRPALLAEALRALRRQTYRLDRIVVIDNASEVETRALLAAEPGVEVVRLDTNVGGAGGFSAGMKYAMGTGADWMWLMDDDAIPQVDALEQLQRQLGVLPANTGAVCSCVMEFGSIAIMHRRSFNPLVGFERAFTTDAYRQPALEIGTASFVGFLVSTRAVAATGFPDPAFFLAYDDTEYSLRIRSRGFLLWLVPASVIVHKRSKGSRLRETTFGSKHYFNVRNRIYVKAAYSRFAQIGAALGAVFGVALWLRSPRRFSRGPCQALLGALVDGYAARLGPFPERLKPKHEVLAR